MKQSKLIFFTIPRLARSAVQATGITGHQEQTLPTLPTETGSAQASEGIDAAPGSYRRAIGIDSSILDFRTNSVACSAYPVCTLKQRKSLDERPIIARVVVRIQLLEIR